MDRHGSDKAEFPGKKSQPDTQQEYNQKIHPQCMHVETESGVQPGKQNRRQDNAQDRLKRSPKQDFLPPSRRQRQCDDLYRRRIYLADDGPAQTVDTLKPWNGFHEQMDACAEQQCDGKRRHGNVPGRRAAGQRCP